ncbi:uncharacterized protein BP01DRAFT_353854 [Aspergillus saccharolyticus JOP 1030-1]|uniref:Uncharacterized protein n=1 Tax=Aspergillus saccharolyticus JOP 1030-1 TaxID=1450539 RepID=A0A318ZQ80_9EURO|nr:hypothetical protein BP01DRAFT_353854 [Aspergillus saccharolyticus JOP 1030-1]PYH48694.1 hypothetical protein BP01DRAFT_353854 [Aspergillus saccharolyticus JOP 1030-1]
MAPPSKTPSPAPSAARTTTASSSSARPSLELNNSPNFTDPSFDPAEYLNSVLPALTLASSQSTNHPRSAAAAGSSSIPLLEMSTQVQSVLSQISAQNVRYSSTLTRLTDEILRGGSRLAYEVEVLRGETIALSDALTETLRGDIAKFAPEDASKGPKGVTTEGGPDDGLGAVGAADGGEDGTTEAPEDKRNTTIQDPEFITKLRMLNQVRARLEEVVQTFGDAMEWPLPPSEMSLASSFISVSAPEAGPESHSREEKGQEVARRLRAEVMGLLDGQGGGLEGVEAAARRIESLRTLALIWKGTAEEKARSRVVDSLAKVVEDRRRALESQGRADASQQASGSSTTAQSAGHRRQESEGPAGGIFRNLQRLREEIYLE